MSRMDKIDSLLQKEISSILQKEISDPKLGFVTISEVKTASDFSLAKVYVSFLGKNYKKRDGIEVLRKSKGRIKSLLAKNINMRKVPDLEFIVDDSLDKIERIEEIVSGGKE